MIRSPSLGLSPVVSVSRTICRNRYSLVRERIRPLVLWMAGVALHPVPLDLVLGDDRIELAPQVLVLDRLLVGGAPAAALPVADPGGDALHHVDRVGVELDLARALERLQRADRGHQLHAVVGGLRLAPVQLLLCAIGS